ncbi:sigma 54-interacting transcriptional regulator [bacterium]|nr:sigma 54-interacting transcriptional regulator [bacterium]
MKALQQLTSSEREFFSIVRKAAIANPFSNERINLDTKIAQFPNGTTTEHDIEKTIQIVEKQIELLKKKGLNEINLFSVPDRDLIEVSFLFLFFYHFRKDFDRLILSQIEAGDSPIKLDFADKAISFLWEKGFTRESIQHHIENSYQIRRAFHFIDRNLIGRSPAMKILRFDLWNNIFTHNMDLYRRYLWNQMEDFSTLILGETGTGKGAVAVAIGSSGFIPFDMKKQRFVESFTRSFVSINLSQFPETLIESELFGHKKGSFTGAIDDHNGVFERCSSHGAIFLDEIGEISQQIQIKLLQVLQERVFYPVGSRKQERFQGRVIAATNHSFEELRNNKTLRDDFYYRLCSDIIFVPPLRQRIQEDPAELDDLLDFLIKRMVGESSAELTNLVKEVITTQLGRDYPWYGNVRELEQCVRRVILKKKYDGYSPPEKKNPASKLATALDLGNLSANSLLAGYCKLLYERHGTYEEVARRTKLDRRTVTKYIKDPQNLD